MAAYSLLLPNPISSIPKTLNLSSLSFPAKTQFLISSCSSISFPSTLTLLRKSRSLELTTVTKVALTSKYGREEDEGVLSGGRNGSFSPDLKLFVGNLPFTVDSSELAGLFESAGNVEMVEVIYDKLTGRSRGFGFVTMSTVEEAEAAAQQFNGYELNGRALRVNSGPPPPREELPSRGFRSGGGEEFQSRGFRSGGGGGGEEFQSRGFRSGGGGGEEFPSRGFRSGGGGGSFDSANRVYVGNLSWGVDNLSLETLFSEQGKVLDARVVYDRETGRSRGFGFVTLSSAAEVNSAISSLDGSDLDGRNIRVSAAEAKPPRREF